MKTEYARGGVIECTSNRAAPVLDTIFTLTNVASVVYVAGQDNVVNKGSSVGLGLGVATLWALSAVYGYQNTSACEEAQQAVGGYSPYARTVRPGTPARSTVPAPAPTTGWVATQGQPASVTAAPLPPVNPSAAAPPRSVSPPVPAVSPVRQQLDPEAP